MWILRLFRWPNLLIVVLTQYLLRHAVLGGAYGRAGLDFALSEVEFASLVLATVLAAAGGYLINDLYDFDIDRINKPEKIVIGRSISLSTAWRLYAGLHLLGLGLVLYLAVQLRQLYLMWFFPLIWFLLWLYSRRLKALPFWGNFAVAVFCSAVVWLVWESESAALARLAVAEEAAAFEVQATFVFYSFFAFASTLYRELVKDLQDMEGDRAYGCRTFPIVHGVRRAKYMGLFWGGMLAVGSMGWLFWTRHLLSIPAALYILALVGLNGYSLYLFWRSRCAEDFGRASQYIKLLMLLGLLYLLVSSI